MLEFLMSAHFRSLFCGFLGLLLVNGKAVAQDSFYRPKLDEKTITSTLGADWYGLYLNDKKIGYFASKRERDGKERIRETVLMSMKIASFGKKAEMQMKQEMLFESKFPHRLLRAEQTQSNGMVALKTILEKTEKGYLATLFSGKNELKKNLDDLDYTLADATASELWLRGTPKEGETINYREFSMEELRVDTQTAKLLSRKKSLVNGVEVDFSEVESVSNRTKLKMKSLHDAEGRLLSGNIALFELRRETEEQAKNTEFSADLFVLGQVKVDRPLGRIDRIEELVLEVKGKGGEIIPDGPLQNIEKNADGMRVLKIGKKFGKEARPSEIEIKEALEETTALPFSHPRIQKLAKEAVGDAKSDRDKVKNLVKFTYKYIRPSLTTDPPEIHHLLDRKSGDCKCYARLFCVLARANGIPAREVSGFVYMGDAVKAFGGHAWNEVVLDGVWTPLDASLNRTEATAGHVFLGTEKDAAGILETLGRLSFRVIDIKSAK